MKRHWLGWVIVLVLGSVGVAYAAPPIGEELQAWMDQTDDRLEDLEARVSALENTTTTLSSTSTTASSSTSSSNATTTTTAPTSSTTTTFPATTTTIGTTTTSTPTTTTTTAGLTIPETLAYPDSRTTVNDGEGFFFMTSCRTSEDFDCGADEVGIDEFTYMGHGMPYLYSEAQEGNHDHAWWVPGDRDAYRCGYAFMYDKFPDPPGPAEHPDGHFIARATIVRPQGQTYGKVNDRYMEEDQRFYDGTFYPGSDISEVQNCSQEALDDFDYENYVPQGPDEIRVGLFRADGEIADIRDFTAKTGHYEFLSLEDGRVSIIQIFDGAPLHVFYYDTRGDGRIAVEVNGALIGD